MLEEKIEQVIVAVQVEEEITAKGYKANIKVITKNGVKKVGIEIGDASSQVITPVYYPETFEGSTKEIAEQIIEHYEKENSKRENIAHMINRPFEEIKDKLILCLEPVYDSNHITRPYLDLQMYVRYKVFPNVSIVVYQELMDNWKIDEDELFATAMENTKRDMTITQSWGMLVCGNKEKRYGAAFLAMTDRIKELADTFGKDLYFLPSSIHEVYALTENMFPDVEGLKWMVEDANDTVVSPQERLSYSVYKYVHKTGKIEIL